MEKVLSISIANYNNSDKLDNCLSSLLDEKILKDIEVIVVNDGSKDDSVSTINKYVKAYPETVKLIDKPNGGYGSTINSSLKIAKGKYYRLLDADDSYNTKDLVSFVEMIKKTDVDLIYTDFSQVNINSGEKELFNYDYPQNTETTVDIIQLLRMHSLTIKTKLIQNKISITEHCFYTDMEFAVKCVDAASSFIYLPLEVYLYAIGDQEQSVSKAGFIKHAKEHEKVIQAILPIVTNNPKFDTLITNQFSLVVRHQFEIYLHDVKFKDDFYKFYNYIKNNYAYMLKYIGRSTKTAIRFRFTYKYMVKHISKNSTMTF